MKTEKEIIVHFWANLSEWLDYDHDFELEGLDTTYQSLYLQHAENILGIEIPELRFCINSGYYFEGDLSEETTLFLNDLLGVVNIDTLSYSVYLEEYLRGAWKERVNSNMPFVTLLTDNYIQFHELMFRTLAVNCPQYAYNHPHIILYYKEKLTELDRIKNYLPNVEFLEVPEDFLNQRDESNLFYPHFSMTFAKLFPFYQDRFLETGFVLYDADMLVLKRFNIDNYFNKDVVSGSQDHLFNQINTGFVVFPAKALQETSASLGIDAIIQNPVQLPDQEIINEVFFTDIQVFESDFKILNKPFRLFNDIDINQFDIYHYITANKEVVFDFIKKHNIKLY